MRIALDAMGGDFAPSELIRGAAWAVRDLGVEVILVGDEARITLATEEGGIPKTGLSIMHTREWIPMGEHHPLDALKRNPRASVLLACELVASGKADACVSAGNTGACFISALRCLKRVCGVDRPAIGAPLPTRQGACLIVDAGANVDVRPEHLVSFAIMGSVYMERVMGRPNPRVGLISIGEEESKGNEVTLKAHEALKGSALNFVGNVEGKDIPEGKADVVVCDGFVGNVILKLAEGMGSVMLSMLKESFTKSPLARFGAALARPGLKGFADRMNYEEYGGALLLGVGGVVVVAHGRSQARAIRKAIEVARSAVLGRIVDSIRTGMLESASHLGDPRTREI